MTLKKRIFIFNSLMVFLSLILMLIIASSVISIFKKINIDRDFKVSRIDTNVSTIQNELSSLLIKAPTWSEFAKKIKKMNYDLYVKDSSKVIFSNLKPYQLRNLNFIESEIIEKNKAIIYHLEIFTAVKIVYDVNGGTYSIIAIHDNKEIEKNGLGKYQHNELDDEEYKEFFIIFIIVGLITVLILLLISQIFTKKFVIYIMKPINSLIDGAKRIENNDLNTEIIYKGDEELEEVCNNFNKMQEHLKNEREKNNNYEKARTDMVSGISHDLKTPLTSVKGYIKGIKDGIANTYEKQQLYLDIAYEQACEMDVLLKKLFYFSKLETGKMPFFFDTVNLEKFIEDFKEQMSLSFRDKDIKILYNKSNESHLASIDKEQMKRVFSNITENSIKYSGISSLVLEINLYKEEDKEIITISDNGIGIPFDKLSRVFEQFYRCDESRSNKNADGNGLGLYISKYIVEAHGGTIVAQNINGFTIKIILPSLKGVTNV